MHDNPFPGMNPYLEAPQLCQGCITDSSPISRMLWLSPCQKATRQTSMSASTWRSLTPCASSPPM